MIAISFLVAIAFSFVAQPADALKCYVGGSMSMDDRRSIMECPEADEYCIQVRVNNSDIPFAFMSCQDYVVNATDNDPKHVPCESDGSEFDYVDVAANIYGKRRCCKGDFCNEPEFPLPYVPIALAVIGLVAVVIIADLIIFSLCLQRPPKPHRGRQMKTIGHRRHRSRSVTSSGLSRPRRSASGDSTISHLTTRMSSPDFRLGYRMGKKMAKNNMTLMTQSEQTVTH